MALKGITDSGWVLRAIEEFDAVGLEAFLDRYGFGEATGYFVKIGGSVRPEAIAGADSRVSTRHADDHDEFNGGAASVANRLESLGFEVTRPDRLPNLDAGVRQQHDSVRVERRAAFLPGCSSSARRRSPTRAAATVRTAALPIRPERRRSPRRCR